MGAPQRAIGLSEDFRLRDVIMISASPPKTNGRGTLCYNRQGIEVKTCLLKKSLAESCATKCIEALCNRPRPDLAHVTAALWLILIGLRDPPPP